MTDGDLRGLLLKAFYDNRRGDGQYQPDPSHFQGALDDADILRLSEQLKQKGLIEGQIVRTMGGGGIVFGRITAYGSDVIEGNTAPPFSITMNNNTVNVSGSSNVIVGNDNRQEVHHHVTELAKAIDASGGTPEQKAQAKGLLRQFAEHPLVSAIVGGAIGLF